MEKRSSLKKRLLGLFRSSNCNLTTKSLPGSVQEPVFVSSRRHDHDGLDVDLTRSLSIASEAPHQRLFGSCRPAPKKKNEGRRVPENDALSYDTGARHVDGGKTCLPPASEMNRCFAHQEKKNNNNNTRVRRRRNNNNNNKKKKKKKKKILLFSNPYGFTTSSSSEEEEEENDDDDDNELFSSDEREEETDTLFSSRSFSSDSSEFYYNSSRSGRKTSSRRRRPPRRGASRRQDVSHDGFRPLISISSRVNKNLQEQQHGGDVFPVVKDSDDPYADFRTSMLEMIVEKQTFGKEELQALLRCYLSLNSPHHHPIILKVFSDICGVLFCN